MRVAIIGSRTLKIDNLEDYIPENTVEIISGGANGVDSCAKDFALKNSLTYTEFLPKYDKFVKSAPLKRNLEIMDYADMVIAFWDGKSRGTRFVIENCEKLGKSIKVVMVDQLCQPF